MKFSSSLEFNSVPEWKSEYIDYESLKKRLYLFERAAAVRPGDSSDAEAARLIAEDPVPIFTKILDKELNKINDFYRRTEAEQFQSDDAVQEDLLSNGIVDDGPRYGDTESSEDEGNPDSNMARSQSSLGDISRSRDHMTGPGQSDTPNTPSRRRRRGSSVSAHYKAPAKLSYRQIHIKRELISDYVSLNELSNYVDLNRTGFRKILKKFDKILGTSLLQEYTSTALSSAYVFSPEAAKELRQRIERVVDSYSQAVEGGSSAEALSALKGYLREHVVWERNTVWRDMISLEGQKHGVTQGPSNMGDKPSSDAAPTVLFGYTLSSQLVAWIPAARLSAILLLGALLVIFPLLDSISQSRCFALVVTASLLWATESLPLFVTSLMIPLLVVVLRIPLTKKGHAMTAKEASEFVFSKMWSPVITVLLGGFTLAAALSKYNIAKVLATKILARAGSNPRLIILMLMFVAAFMCMWISNVAAPVLLFSVAQPLLRTLPTGDPFGKAMILGIALASNVGGMISPIASPQNIVALQNMKPQPSWVEWFIVSLPVSIVSVTLIWVMLVATFPTTSAATAIGHIRNTTERFTGVHYYILSVTALTIGLWCFSHQLEPVFGDMGILALVPVIFLFGSGVLTAADFNNFLWTIVALAMGGITLGKAVESCGLLKTVAIIAQAQVQDLGLFGVCAVFGLLILIIASFISHTVAALIVLPLVKSIGEQMDDPHPRVIVMISAFMCSAAMALPTSGFPNVAAICMTNEFGQPYLTVGDFITRGVPASVIVYIVITTLGYFLLSLIGY